MNVSPYPGLPGWLAVGGWTKAQKAQGSDLWLIGLVYIGLALIGLLVDVGLVIALWIRPHRLPGSIARLCDRAWPSEEILKLVAVLVALFTMVFSAQILAESFSTISWLNDSRFWIVLQSLSFHGMGLVIIATYVRRHPPSPGTTYFGLHRASWLRSVVWGLVFYLATIPFIWFYTLLYQEGLHYFGYEPTLQKVAEILTDEQPYWLRVYFMLMGTILAPCFEEIFFRGIALPALARRWGMVPAIFAISLFFALIHFHISSLAPLFIISTAFSLAYLYTESILAPMVMHSVFNAVNLVLMTGARDM